jgi:glycosyltransferase involved in cell wall biosynthesis
MIEAMACGTPVVPTPFGAAPELVSYGQTGYLARSTGGLVFAVEGVGSIDRGECRQTVERRFSMDRLAHDHEVFYGAVLSGHRRRAGRHRRPTPCSPGA